MTKGKETGEVPTRFLISLIHPRTPDEPVWKHLPLVLLLGFIVRSAVALSGDFILHPDEIMQYLEPAHQLVFGNGVTYWEYFYGARSWLVPGITACVIKLFDIVGLGEPVWYVGGVKLFFCAFSLLIPAGMYFFARNHFSEAAARVALLAGAFWYELVVFAHKPMTEFVATALLVVAFWLCIRSAGQKSSGKRETVAALTALLATAVRVQYAPLSLLALGTAFVLTRRKITLGLATAFFLLAIGIFDAATWNGGLFHSYLTNLRFNLVIGQVLMETPSHQFLLWFLLAGGGLGALCVALGLLDLRRYGFLLAPIAAVLLFHSFQAQKEYRFIFAVIPLWLLLGSDIIAELASRLGRARLVAGVAVGAFALVSLAGVFKALPYQNHIYRVYGMGGIGAGSFVGGGDTVFDAYRYLSRAPGVEAVWHVDRYYANLPGYYYLHRKIPFYDSVRGPANFTNLKTALLSVTHIVSENPVVSLSGYSLEREFGNVRILRRDVDEPEVRRWESYNPVIVSDRLWIIMKHADQDASPPPANSGIRFAEAKGTEP
ncbi:MAG: hypothetical protein OXF23_07405 [Candidatus Dadabacteria bacterium]|nr:hypothetical protein [Candidatus Dadabacteria bacterium]